ARDDRGRAVAGIGFPDPALGHGPFLYAPHAGHLARAAERADHVRALPLVAEPALPGRQRVHVLRRLAAPGLAGGAPDHRAPPTARGPDDSARGAAAGGAVRRGLAPLPRAGAPLDLRYPPPMTPFTQSLTARSTLEAIGNTPLVRLERMVPPGSADVLVKLEYVNPTGSYKDRMALAMIERAERRGDLRPGMTVVEYTGGSTGISLAFVCAVKGYRCRIVCNDAVAREKLRSMQIFGAELEVLESVGGKLTADLVPRMMARAREIAAESPSYFTDQMRNPDMVAGYESLGEELVQQVQGPIHAFCACTGTSGMLMGTARVLRRASPRPKVVAFEPATSSVLTGGKAGPHGVEGVAPGFVPPQYDATVVDEARGIDEAEGRRMAWTLARSEGIFAGTSSGLNVTGALQLARELGPGHTVVTVAV